MTLLVLGLSHNSAPLDLLDRAALDSPAVQRLRDDLASSDAIAEVMVLATCNRLEVVAEVDRFHRAVSDATEKLSKHCGIDPPALSEHLYVHFDQAALRHVFAVAAGVDSLVVGEQQIVGQVRASLRDAQDAGTAGRALNSVGQRALRVAKRVRGETGIDRHGASIVSVGLDLVEREIGGLGGKSALVLGAGAMGSLAVSRLSACPLDRIVVASRTTGTAARLASTHGAEAADISDLPEVLGEVDVLVSATGSADVVVSRADITAALCHRDPARGPFAVLDLALPHDTDPAIARLPGAVRIDLARLAEAAETRAAQGDVEAALEIVAGEAAAFVAEQSAQRVEPVLVSLRAKADTVMAAELVRLRGKLPHLAEPDIVAIERAWRRAVSALLHAPTVRMKQFATSAGGDRYAAALHALFDLDPDAIAALIGSDSDFDSEIG